MTTAVSRFVPPPPIKCQPHVAKMPLHLAVSDDPCVTINQGAIGSICLPSSWHTALGDSYCHLRPVGDDDVCVRFNLRGQLVGSGVTHRFRRLLAQKPATVRAEVLLPSEIRTISEMLGVAALNQHAFSESFDFLLSHAATVQLSRKTMVEVRGRRLAPDGELGPEFCAYYFEVGNNGRIQEIILEGSFMQLVKYSRHIKQILSRIEWQD